MFSGNSFAPLTPFRGFLVSFRNKGFFARNRKRPEEAFTVEPVTARHIPRFIGFMPFCPARTSAAAQPFPRPSPEALPLLRKDTSPASEIANSRSLLSEEQFPRPLAKSRWDIPHFRKLAAIYPFRDVAALALEAISDGGLNVGFIGDRKKQVLSANRNLNAEDRERIRGRLLEETQCVPPRVAGPFAICPFPNAWSSSEARTVPVRTNRAKKYDPSSEKFRLVSNFSKHFPSSVNDLCFNPKLVEFSFHSKYLMMILARLGEGAQATLFDIQKAYRWQWSNPSDLHLATYMLADDEFFVDLAHPFGWITAQWTYQAISAILRYAVLEQGACHAPVGSSSVLGVYVDNWALFSSKGDKTHDSRAARLKSTIEACGPSTHEFQSGTRFNSLGWDWDTSRMIISCPEDKLNFIRNKLNEVAGHVRSPHTTQYPMIDVVDAEMIVGFMNWMSVAWREAKRLINPLRIMLKINQKKDKSRMNVQPDCAHAILMAASFLEEWPGSRPFFQDFSPIASWEFLIRSDGSTSHGAGAVLYPGCLGYLHQWDEAERARLLNTPSHSSEEPLIDTSLERESSSIAELLAILYALWTFGPQIKGRRVLLEFDNESMYFALRRWFSDKSHILVLLDEIFKICFSFSIILRVEYIPREFNTVADALSTGHLSQATKLCREQFGPRDPLVLVECSRGLPQSP